MRRLVALLVTAGLTIGLAGTATSAAASAPGQAASPGPDGARGLVFDGLDHEAGARCRAQFALVHAGVCTHGPDPAPAGLDVRARRMPTTTADDTGGGSGLAAATSGIQCYGDGQSGDRVQLVYAHAADVGDRYSQFLGSFGQWAAQVDQVFTNSAAETGGARHVRFVTDSQCNLSVLDLQLSTSGDDNMDNTVTELHNRGYNRSDRKYLVWVDSNVYCGIAQVYGDDSGGQSNLSNGNSQVPGEVARVDNGCWGVSGQSIEAHELMHTLGGVQTSAPHATSYNHCWDEQDRMCYDDGSGAKMQQYCSGHENLFDCDHDDYFSTAPSGGSYLATHWNTANSAFLATSGGSSPTPPTTAPPTTSPPTTVPPTTDPPPGGGGTTAPPSSSSAGGYTLDAFGGIHPYGGAPSVTGEGWWPGENVARGIAMRPDRVSGYVLDRQGGIHPFGDAPHVVGNGWWPGEDVARGITLDPGDPTGTSGWVVDAFGGLHPFGNAPFVYGNGWWPGQDVARGVVASAAGQGYVVDLFGGTHPFGGAADVTGDGWWPGQDMARGIVASGASQGYVLDRQGGLHPFGGAPYVSGVGWWPGSDMARGASWVPGLGGGYVVDPWGNLYAYWTSTEVARVSPSATWAGIDGARGVG